MTYAEKLRSPLWQKKRLAILERDKYTCQWCRDTETELQIHHLFYHKGREPYDYKDEHLITYCKHCHALAELIKGEFKDIQIVHSVFKYTQFKTDVIIFAVVSNTQNLKFAAIFNFDNLDNSIEYVLSIPEHVISRLHFLLETLNQKENGSY